MNCEELNKRYGAPGRIVFRNGPQGYPVVALANQYGSAEISLFGAQVLSYKPTGNFPVLFTPQKVDGLGRMVRKGRTDTALPAAVSGE